VLGSADPPLASQKLRARLLHPMGTCVRLPHLSLPDESANDRGLQCRPFAVPDAHGIVGRRLQWAANPLESAVETHTPRFHSEAGLLTGKIKGLPF